MTTLLALQRAGPPARRLAAGDARGAEDQDRGRARAARPRGRDRRRGLRGDLSHAAPRREGERGGRRGDEAALRARLGARRGDQRDLRRSLQPASTHVLRPVDQARATRRSSTSSTRSWATGRATTARSTSGTRRPSQIDAYKQCREWLDAAIELVRPGATTDEIAAAWPTAEEIGMQDERAAFGLQFGHGLGVGLYEFPMISRLHSLDAPAELEVGHGLRARDVLPGERRSVGGPNRGGGRGHAETGREVITRFPADELLVTGKTYVRGADVVDGRVVPSVEVRRRRDAWRRKDAQATDVARSTPTPRRRTSTAGCCSSGDSRIASRASSSEARSTARRTCTRDRKPSRSGSRACSASGDRIACTYRGHGHLLAMGTDPTRAARRAARPSIGRQRRARRLDERRRPRQPGAGLLRDRGRQHRGGHGRRDLDRPRRAESPSRTSATAPPTRRTSSSA